MDYVFSMSRRGYSHEKTGKPCQDAALSYVDRARQIAVCCDGHGGDIYVRSQRGSQFACEAILRSFRELTPAFLRRHEEDEVTAKIRMDVLCEWARLVHEDLSSHNLSKKELEPLSETQRETLWANPIKAYGSTMAGAMRLGHKIIVASIGDTECLLLRNGTLERPLFDEDDPAGNITYSLCQDDAYAYIRAKMIDARGCDGVFLCTDGFSGPFQTYDNLLTSFLKPLVRNSFQGNPIAYAEDVVTALAESRGSGDDVSVAFLLKKGGNYKKYR